MFTSDILKYEGRLKAKKVLKSPSIHKHISNVFTIE